MRPFTRHLFQEKALNNPSSGHKIKPMSMSLIIFLPANITLPIKLDVPSPPISHFLIHLSFIYASKLINSTNQAWWVLTDINCFLCFLFPAFISELKAAVHLLSGKIWGVEEAVLYKEFRIYGALCLEYFKCFLWWLIKLASWNCWFKNCIEVDHFGFTG